MQTPQDHIHTKPGNPIYGYFLFALSLLLNSQKHSYQWLQQCCILLSSWTKSIGGKKRNTLLWVGCFCCFVPTPLKYTRNSTTGSHWANSHFYKPAEMRSYCQKLSSSRVFTHLTGVLWKLLHLYKCMFWGKPWILKLLVNLLE